MKTAIIIPSVGRSRILGETLSRLKNQTEFPAQVLVVVNVESDLPEKIPDYVNVVFSEKGLTKQRNKGMERSGSDIDILLFIDDDTFLHPRYLENMESIFNKHDNIAGLTGCVLKNGDVTIKEADDILSKQPLDVVENKLVWRRGLYGCNFGVRKSLLSELRFDERLVLYGWLEDADFSFNLSKLGELYSSPAMRCVHLMYSSGGRTNHIRFGFSQVMNPYYLCKKNKHSLFGMMKSHWFKGVTANMFGIVFGPGRRGRMGRLRGNLIAFGFILRGRICPEFAGKL